MRANQCSRSWAEETAAAALELDTQAARMRENVAALQKLVGGVATQLTSISTAANAGAAKPGRRSAAQRSPGRAAPIGS